MVSSVFVCGGESSSMKWETKAVAKRRQPFFCNLEEFLDLCGDFVYHNIASICRCGGIGRHTGLKIRWDNTRTGSTPVSGTRTGSRQKWREPVFISIDNL